MTWGKYSHLSTYHFLQALEAEGVHPDAIEYIQHIICKYEEVKNELEDANARIETLEIEIEIELNNIEDDVSEYKATIRELESELKELKSQLEKK